ncbi:SCO2521 family protein [Streptomyces sp. NPDC020917]|uniref:SCO2521 family protein n=1 Tax=Streptomyces sp. NPDC020917 TaxID=3365102 RepID=UPI0037A97B9D
MAPADSGLQPVLCGEVRTSVLRTSEALTARTAAQLLNLRPDEPVLLSERPNLRVVSPHLLTGVDCRLPAAGGSRPRAVGTVAGRAVLTEGRVLQTSAFARLVPSEGSHRRAWGHYLLRPGVVEPLARHQARDVVDGFLAAAPLPGGVLNPGAVAERLLDHVLRHPLLDQRAPFKSGRTRLRWAALPAAEGAGASIERFTVAADGLRTVALRTPVADPAAVAALCEDLALHDWLLTTLLALVERSRLGSGDGEAVLAALRPLVDHLLHLWMPGARVPDGLSGVWETLEKQPGFSRQWQTLVQRIRDQVAVQTAPLSRRVLASS